MQKFFAKAESRLVALKNVRGADLDFQKKSQEEYCALVHEQELQRVRGRLVQGRQREARVQIRRLNQLPFAWLLRGLLASLLELRRSPQRLMSSPKNPGKGDNMTDLPPDSKRVASPIVVRVINAQELASIEEVWWKLSSAAVVLNAFYEPWTVLAAVEYLADKERLRFLLVFGPAGEDGKEPLWGFFPLEIQNRCLHLPIRCLTFWQHKYCFLAVPLIHADYVVEVLQAFWRWFDENPFRCRILDTNYLLAERPLLADWIESARGRSALMLNEYPRAFLNRQFELQSAHANLALNVSKKHHDQFLRQERRLAELGRLQYRELESLPEVDPWVDEFLRLEASGWKGNIGTAIAKRTQDVNYLRAITREGFARRRVMLLSMLLDNKVIAMKYNLLAGDGGFIFKIAFDEEYSKYSPGLLLELENMRRFFDDPQIKWLDSCALARHPMFNRIWSGRRMISRTLFSDGSRLADFWISAIPLLRWVRRRVRPEVIPPHLRISTNQKQKD